MPWQRIQGHDSIVERFRQAARRGRLAGTFFFVGPGGVGKRLFAVALAKGLLCKGNGEYSIDPCEECESCRLFGSQGSSSPDDPSGKTPSVFLSPHPDLYYVSRPEGKTLLPLELLIGDKNHRGEAGLCYDISRTPFLGHRKVAIVDDADFLNDEGRNAILKTLEEPPPGATMILIGTSTTKQLPTIRSRCQIIRFSPLPTRLLATMLLERGMVSTLEQGLQVAKRAGGSLDDAKDWVDETVDRIKGELVRFLSSKQPDRLAMSKIINELVSDAGKEAILGRRRLRLIFFLVIELLRERMKKFEAPHHPDEGALTEEKRQTEAMLAVRRLERTLNAIEQIDYNANLPLVVDAWCTDLTN